MEHKPVINATGKGLTDYSSGMFLETYIEGDAIYYAGFHPELCAEEDGLDATGRYLVVLLQPIGLFQFHVVRENDKWVPDLEEYGDNQIDVTLDNIVNRGDNSNVVNAKNFTLPVSQEKLDWISDCIIKHRK